ncbi:hypothetical protein NQZ68_022617 [Dissostichus eleginoides]|nr:hypothetical protein NQZ68_022617 [Dissostichus eleginoides]
MFGRNVIKVRVPGSFYRSSFDGAAVVCERQKNCAVVLSSGSSSMHSLHREGQQQPCAEGDFNPQSPDISQRAVSYLAATQIHAWGAVSCPSKSHRNTLCHTEC